MTKQKPKFQVGFYDLSKYPQLFETLEEALAFGKRQFPNKKLIIFRKENEKGIEKVTIAQIEHRG